MEQLKQEFLEFMDSCHSVYHAAEAVRKNLERAGFTQLVESEKWDIQPGGKYYVTRGNASVIAFRVPMCVPKGFMISAAHVDRPAMKFRENGELVGAYTRAGVEGYGGMLLAPWLDRPLSIAGRVLVKTEEGARTALVDIDRDLLLIPNVAIHMNRQANDGYKWNMASDMQPLLGSAGEAGRMMQLLEEQAGGEILGHDLYLYVRQRARVWGLEQDYVSAQGLDDLQCVWSCLQGFLRAKESGDITVLCAFNSEEVGSRTRDGADSGMLGDVLTRTARSLGLETRRLLAQSFMVSADNAHAIHPNHPELADPANAPMLGKGPVIKFNAKQRYSTDGLCAALFRTACSKAGVNVQTYCNRPDIPGGSTLGNISISHVSVPTADVGLPQLAMHSCIETACLSDTLDMVKTMEVLYGSTLIMSEGGFSLAD